MSRLAHATYAAPGLDMRARRKAMAPQIQREVVEAKRIQQQTGCTWTEALRLAYKGEMK